MRYDSNAGAVDHGYLQRCLERNAALLRKSLKPAIPRYDRLSPTGCRVQMVLAQCIRSDMHDRPPSSRLAWLAGTVSTA